jgi:hypothetical protein
MQPDIMLRASNDGFLAAQTQPSMFSPRAISPQFAACVLKFLRSCLSHRLTLRSRGGRPLPLTLVP